MPIRVQNDLPVKEILEQENIFVMDESRAAHQDIRPISIGLLNLMQAQQSAAEYGIMYAGLVMVMLPTLILYICVQKKLIQGMTVGGLKG